jgi:hypothetical protein
MTVFDLAVFTEQATQLRFLADEYAALGLDASEAARWANRGFLPDEAASWLAEGHSPERASYWANKYTVSPAAARKEDGR